MLFLIVTMMISALCVVFECYDDVWGALFFFFSIVAIMSSALCVVFYFYDEDLRALCCF